METPVDPAAQLREQERAAALPYIEYPPTPLWYPPAVGLWTAVLLTAVLYRDQRPTLLGVAVIALIGVEILFLRWYRRRRGTMPSLRGAPKEFHQPFRNYFLGLAIALCIVIGASQTLPHLTAATMCFVVVTVGIALYERVYAKAAAATRERLR